MTDPIASRLTEALGSSYTLEGELGRGGMGVVYHARDERLKRRVAIKVLPPDLAFRDEIRTRFLREAETAARLSHPHIVPIHAVGEGPNGLVYFIMTFVDGESLGARLKRRRSLPIEEARRILVETADALGAAHALGIIHRDVKPDNILLEGSRGRVIVTDFGIAKALSSTTGPGTLTATGVAIGTPHYMSPEQAAGEREIDGRSDIYSLGVVGYQMLTGRLPFEAPTVAGILMKQITEDPKPIPEVRPDCPDELAACVVRSLEKEPELRWPTADALRRALEARNAAPYRSARRPPPASRCRTAPPAGSRGALAEPARARPPAAAGAPGARPGRRGRRHEAPELDTVGGEPRIVRQMRGSFVSWASLSGGFVALDLLMGGGLGWSLWASGIWAGFGLLPQYLKLWNSGYSWRDVLHRPAAPDAAEVRLEKAGARPAELPPAGRDEFGHQAAAVNQARGDRKAILRIVSRLPEAERKQLPDVVATADGLLRKAEELARMMHTMSGGVDDGALGRLDEKLAAARRQPGGAERDRQLSLLERQQRALGELVNRRRSLGQQIDSCVVAMQNVRFDLLRLRSAGLQVVLGDLTQATEQARALSRDVDHVIAAAGEVRELLGEKPPA